MSFYYIFGYSLLFIFGYVLGYEEAINYMKKAKVKKQ